MARVVLLGPQSVRPTLPEVVSELELSGRVATITAGWQDNESDDGELDEALGGGSINLRLYERAEEILRDDTELLDAYRARQEKLQELQRLYRVRLAAALDVARDLLGRDGDRTILEPEQRQAVEAVRSVDAHHVARLRELHAAFEMAWHPASRPAVARHRHDLMRIVDQASAVVVAGGHVLVLLNRMRLFGIAGALVSRAIVAWSAGAMVLGERVVVFHDSPPQGRGNAELIDVGLNVVPRVLPFPHARSRLRLADPLRVALLARRFQPLVCVPFDEGVRVDLDNGTWRAAPGTSRMASDGILEPL